MAYQPGNNLLTQNAGLSPQNLGIPHIDVRDPTNSDSNPIQYPQGKTWLNKLTGSYFINGFFTSSGGITTANWQQLSTSTGDIDTINGDAGSVSPTAGAVTISGGTTGLTTSGSGSTLNLTGTLVVANGGTGVATLTGLALGAGTSALTAVTYTPVTAWTPALQINGSSTGITYSPAPTGFYQRIGSMVYFNADINLSSKGVSTGNVTISNLPISSGPNGLNNFVSIIPASVTFSTTNTNLYGVCGTSNTVLSLNQTGTGLTPGPLVNTNLADNSSLLITGFYFIN